MKHELDSFQAEVEYSFTLAEISRCCGVTAEQILVLVSQGILQPSARSQRDWRFAAGDLAKARSALRLQRDLGVNAAGAALAIELIDETESLRERIRVLESMMS